mmetsp:Transcript_43179/g.111954  ORF Transcript_43179/g.111954 Transcript_43179/m.111954 type:complete len:217 (+) Transcript_43179:572-1222(+)
MKDLTLDEEKVEWVKPDNYKPDPTARRTGAAPEDSVAQVILKTVSEAKESTSNDLVSKKTLTTRALLQNALDGLKGAIMIAYPEGLPEYDPVRQILDDTEVLEGAPSQEILDIESTTMWWAGKEILREQKMGDRVGKNEKTKIVVKLQKKGQGAPSREPLIDQKTQEEMMSYYHKKQEEMKKLTEDSEDAYLNSSWANPGTLKGQLLNGGRDVRWK